MKSRIAPILGFIAILSFYLILSTKIRPIADDYCAGAGSVDGIWNYIVGISQNWGGDYLQIFLNASLVGFPIANWSISMVGFTTLALSVVLLMVIQFQIFSFVYPHFESSRNKKNLLAGSTLILILWNLFWSLPASLKFGFYYEAYAMPEKSFSGVFGWPTVIVQYLVAPSLITVGLFFKYRETFFSTLILVTVGFLSGLSGYSLGLALIFTLIVLRANKRLPMNTIRFVALEISISAGLLLSFYSPGSRNRTQILFADNSSLTDTSIIRWVFVSLLEFFASILNIGNLIVLISTTLIFYICGLNLIKLVDFQKLRNLSRYMAVFLLIYYTSISFSEYFTYEAFWHLITYRSILFFFFTVLGLHLSTWLLNYESRRQLFHHRFLATNFLALGLSLAIICAWQANASLINRGNVWISSTAPLPGISDIEPRGNWVDLCWKKLQQSRILPDRY